LESHKEGLVFQGIIVRGKCTKGKGDLLLKEFLSDHVVEAVMKVVEVEGGVAILLSEHFSNCSVLELSIEDSPFVTKSSHVLDTFLMLLLGQCGGGGLGQGVQCWCTVWTDCHLLFLLWG